MKQWKTYLAIASTPVSIEEVVLGEALWGVQNASELDPGTIRQIAVSKYSLARAGELYQAWFDQLDGLSVPGGDFYTREHSGTSKYQRYVTIPE